MDKSKRVITESNVQQFVDDLKTVFEGRSVSLRTTMIGIGSHEETLKVEKISTNEGGMTIRLDGDFIILMFATDPEVEWLDDNTISILKSEGEQLVTMSLTQAP